MTLPVWGWQWPDINAELLLSKEAYDVFAHARQLNGMTERGGQLFVDPLHPCGVVLSLATPPHPADRAGRTWLELNAERCIEEIKEANVRRLRLIGYWHTHPQNIPQISPADISSFAQFARRYAQELPHPVAVIVGTSSAANGIKAWSFHAGKYVEATQVTLPFNENEHPL
ncbi:Mov34/MPN/PAD-1 family protein [Salmonella enterica]